MGGSRLRHGARFGEAEPEIKVVLNSYTYHFYKAVCLSIDVGLGRML